MGRFAGVAVFLAAAWAGTPSASSAAGQTDAPIPIERDFTVRIWRKEHGLPDNRVLSLLTDSKGFLWIGTRKGVSRFDGRGFMTWSRSTDAAFVSEECFALAEDREGGIWVGTQVGVVQLADSLTHHPLNSVIYTNEPPVSHESKVTGLLVTPENELFAATTAGLVRRSPAGQWWRPWPEHEVLFALARTPDGSVWVGSAGRQFPSFNPAPVTVPCNSELTNPELSCVHALAVTRDGTLWGIIGRWVGNMNYLYHLTPAGWQRVSNDLIRNPADPRFLFADANGGLWYSLTNGALVRREGGQRTAYQLPASLTQPTPLCMAQDQEGNLWLGMVRDGLICLQPRAVQALTAREGLKDDNVWTVLETTDRALWVGTDSGVTRFERTPTGGFIARETLDVANVRALTEDREGRIWIGTRSGLYIRSESDLAEIRFPGEWFNSKIRALHTSRDGAMWVATAMGLHCLHTSQTNSWRYPEELPHHDVRVILEDRAGAVWVGTDGGGLARLTETVFERFNETNGLSSLRVWALHEDTEGALWIGTDRGLNRLRNGTIRVLTTEQGLPVNLVNGIAEDTHGCLWVGHDLGVYRVSREELAAVLDGKLPRARCIAYDEEDGLLNAETNGQISYPPAIRLREGRLAFATVAGVALVTPSRPPDLTNPPPAHIERLLAAGETLFSGQPGNSGWQPSTAAQSALRIPPQRHGIVEIHFTAPAYRATEKLHFRYRLLGLSADWIDAGTLRQASYANLKPGDYTFEVAAANKHGYWSASPARLALHLEPRWHERVSTRIAGVVALVLLAVVGLRRRLLKIHRLHRLEQQATRAEERARLAKDLHDSLGSDLTELTLLSNVGESASPPPDEMARRFNQLSQRTHEALHSLRDLIWTTHPRADSLEELASRLCEHAERLLRTAGVNCRFDLPAQLPERMLEPDLRRNLLLAANEAVHNAVRHARPTEVWLRLRVKNGSLAVTVEDNGCGFDPAKPDKPKGSNMGLGLTSMRERVESVGGQCQFTSQPGEGTRVTFRIPLPPP